MSLIVNGSFFLSSNADKTKREKTFDVLLPVQLNPSPMYPPIHVQVKLPGVLVQSAYGLQPPLLNAHSSTSVTERTQQ